MAYTPPVPAAAGSSLYTLIDLEAASSVDIAAGGDGTYSVGSSGGSTSVDLVFANTANANALDLTNGSGIVSNQTASSSKFTIVASELGSFGNYDQITILMKFSGTISGSGKRLSLRYANAAATYFGEVQRRHDGADLLRWSDRTDNSVNSNDSGTVDNTAYTAIGLRIMRNEITPLYGTWSDPYPTVSGMTEGSRIPFLGAVGATWPWNRSTDVIHVVFNQGSGNVVTVGKVAILKALS